MAQWGYGYGGVAGATGAAPKTFFTPDPNSPLSIRKQLQSQGRWDAPIHNAASAAYFPAGSTPAMGDPGFKQGGGSYVGPEGLGGYGVPPATLGDLAKGGGALITGAGGAPATSAGAAGISGSGNAIPRSASPGAPAISGEYMPAGSSGPATPQGDLGYGFKVNDFLDPSMAFRMREGTNAIENSAAGRGSLMSGDTLRDLERFSQGLASTEYGNAWNRGVDRRNFEYGVDTGDRNFDYAANAADRAFEMERLGRLAQLGASSASSANSGSNALVAAIAQLMSQRGNIDAGGIIGGNNAVNGGISQILSQLLGNDMLGRLGIA